MSKRVHAGYDARGVSYEDRPLIGVTKFVETLNNTFNIFSIKDVFSGETRHLVVFDDQPSNKEVFEMMKGNQDHLAEVFVLHHTVPYHKYPNKPGHELTLSDGTSIEASTVASYMVCKRNPDVIKPD